MGSVVYPAIHVLDANQKITSAISGHDQGVSLSRHLLIAVVFQSLRHVSILSAPNRRLQRERITAAP